MKITLTPEIVIMIGGKAGSGKDTVCNYITSKNNYFKQYSFAKALKEHVGCKYGISDRLLYTQEGKRQIIKVKDEEFSVRDLLILEAFQKRLFNENHWVDLTIQDISKDSPRAVVISDFRFPNEYVKMKQKFKNVITVNITRDLHENISDISENSLDNFHFDFWIDNNTTLDNLFLKIDSVLEYI